MSLSPQLLKILVCPRCKGELDYQQGQGSAGDPSESSLVCPACRLRYPVRDDIPIMLVDEATPL
ncbi:MAG: Trm112 family protein [Gemmatimonadaceae bacterium]